MTRSFFLFTATLSLIITASAAWVISSQIRHRSFNPTTIQSLQSKSTNHQRTSQLYATNNSEESSTLTLPSLSTIFKRADTVAESTETANTNFNYATQQRKVTAKFTNSDADIDNFTAETDSNESLLLVAATTLTVGLGLLAYTSQGNVLDPSAIIASGSSLVASAQDAFADPGAALDRVVDSVDSMGTLGIAYFGVAYCIAEILAVPAIPLTASAGYLFGPIKGTAIVLFSAAIAAGVSFQIGRTLLRDFVEEQLKDYPKFAKIDKAIGREGFKLMLLLRLSPIFPFALSNYLYGASSINFPAFFGGTILGFAPGTLAYVYTGYVGKALTGDAGSDVYPWYVYLGGLTLFAGLLKVVADTATSVIEEIEAEEAQ